MADLLLAFCTVLFAIIYIHAAMILPQLAVGDEVGPRAFPELIGIGLLVGGLLLAWERWRARTAARGPEIDVATSSSRHLVLTGLVVWTALYYAAFERAGYVIATVVYAAGALFFFHRSHWYWNLLIAAAFTAVAYLVFAKGLGVVLPDGLLGFGDAGA